MASTVLLMLLFGCAGGAKQPEGPIVIKPNVVLDNDRLWLMAHSSAPITPERKWLTWKEGVGILQGVMDEDSSNEAELLSQADKEEAVHALIAHMFSESEEVDSSLAPVIRAFVENQIDNVEQAFREHQDEEEMERLLYDDENHRLRMVSLMGDVKDAKLLNEGLLGVITAKGDLYVGPSGMVIYSMGYGDEELEKRKDAYKTMLNGYLSSKYDRSIADSDIPFGYRLFDDNVLDVVEGDGGLYILKSDHSLWAFGINGDGQLGTGNKGDNVEPLPVMNKVTQIHSAGDQGTYAITESGDLYAWGTAYETTTPVKLQDNMASIIPTRSGSLYFIDNNMQSYSHNDHGTPYSPENADGRQQLVDLEYEITSDRLRNVVVKAASKEMSDYLDKVRGDRSFHKVYRAEDYLLTLTADGKLTYMEGTGIPYDPFEAASDSSAEEESPEEHVLMENVIDFTVKDYVVAVIVSIDGKQSLWYFDRIRNETTASDAYRVIMEEESQPSGKL